MKNLTFTILLAAVATLGLSACETYTSQDQARTAGKTQVVGSQPRAADHVFRKEQMK